MSQEWTKKMSWISIVVMISMVSSLFLPEYQMAYAVEKQQNTEIELEELRTEYSKTYKKGDEYILEEYLEPIHVEKQGHWVEIDNTIESISRQDAMDEELLLENKENAYRIGFAKNSKAKKLIRFQLDDAHVDFGLIDGKAVEADHKDNRISYSSVYPEVDLVFHTGNTGVKEEWVLHSYDGKRKTFTMSFDTRGVKTKPQKDGSINFVDEKGEVSFTIPRPYMVDANLRYSDNLSFEIREEGGQTIGW